MYIFRIKREGNILDLIQIKYMILGKIAILLILDSKFIVFPT